MTTLDEPMLLSAVYSQHQRYVAKRRDRLLMTAIKTEAAAQRAGSEITEAPHRTSDREGADRPDGLTELIRNDLSRHAASVLI